MGVQATRQDETINQGAVYTLRASVTETGGGALDLTGYAASFVARPSYDSTTLTFEWLSTSSPSYFNLQADGSLDVDVPADITGGLTAGQYRYTINIWEISNENSTKERALEGIITVTPQVPGS